MVTVAAAMVVARGGQGTGKMIKQTTAAATTHYIKLTSKMTPSQSKMSAQPLAAMLTPLLLE